MKRIPLEEHKEIMLEILIYIDLLARENGLNYSLWGGTMLGSIRHKGFIPWDDDIDISMPREDYTKLLNILKEQEKYLLFENTLQEDYTWGWAKLTDKHTIDRKKKFFNPSINPGVFVDIIPIDGFPKDENEIKKIKRKLHRLNLMIKSSNFPSYASSIYLKKSIQKLILLFPIYIYVKIRGGKKRLIHDLENLSSKYNIDESHKCGHLLSRYKSNLGYPSSIWNSLSEYEFEGHFFKGISDSHTYLSLLYGQNYMEIPSKEKQITHEEHEFYRMDGVKNEYRNDYGKWQRSENGSKYTKTIY